MINELCIRVVSDGVSEWVSEWERSTVLIAWVCWKPCKCYVYNTDRSLLWNISRMWPMSNCKGGIDCSISWDIPAMAAILLDNTHNNGNNGVREDIKDRRNGDSQPRERSWLVNWCVCKYLKTSVKIKEVIESVNANKYEMWVYLRVCDCMHTYPQIIVQTARVHNIK